MEIYSSELGALTIHKLGSPGGEAYLLCTKERSLLYDSGFAHSAPALVREIEAVLDGRELDYLFYTHSHYDHVSGGPWIKRRWPEALVLGSAHTARVLARPGARALMLALNNAAAEEGGAGRTAEADEVDEYDPAVVKALLDTLAVEVITEEGTVIDMGDVTFEVMAAPGHTNCSQMLWCAGERLLLGSESLGVLSSGGKVVPICLTGYHDSLATIAKAWALAPEHILLNHRQVVSGADARQYLKAARQWGEKTARLVWNMADEGRSKEEMAAVLKELLFDEVARQVQPEAAFDLNNGLLIDQLLSCERGLF